MMLKSLFRLAPALLLLGLLFVLPLALVIEQSFDTVPRTAAYAWFLSSASMRLISYRTLQLAAGVTAICLLISYPACIALCRLPARWQRIVLALLFLPSFASFLVRTYGWMAFLGSAGPVNWLLGLFGQSDGTLVGTFSGLCIAMAHMLLPFQMLPLYTTLRTIPDNQARAALSLGVSPAATFFTVTLPQTFKAACSGAVLVFILCSGFFITPALIGGTQQTTLAQIIYSLTTQLLDWPRSSVAAVMLFVMVVAILALFSKTANYGQALGIRTTVTDASTSDYRDAVRYRLTMRLLCFWPAIPRRLQLPNILPALSLVVAIALAVVPLFYVLLISFQRLPILKPPSIGQLSVRWYSKILHSDDWISGLQVSLSIALCAALIACAVALFCSYELQRRPAWRGALTPMLLGPAIVPQIVLAVGLYRIFGAAHLLGTYTALIASHAMLGVPYAFIALSNGLRSYKVRLDQASFSLGASPLRTSLKIRLPLLLPSLLGAFFFAFQVSMDEVVFASLLSTPDMRTLPMVMYAAATQDLSPELGAVGVIVIGAIALLGVMLTLFAQRTSRRSIVPSPDISQA